MFDRNRGNENRKFKNVLNLRVERSCNIVRDILEATIRRVYYDLLGLN